MISKAHIISFALMISLYLGVAIWKWTPLADDHQKSEKISRISAESIDTRFWNHYNHATELRSKKLYKKAAEEYSLALALNSNHKDALYYAGSMYLMASEFEKAHLQWNQLLQEEPNAPRTNLQLGTLHFCMDQENPYFDLEKAYRYFSEAWSLNLEETGAPLLLSKIHLLNNDPVAAEELLSDILSVNGTNVQALFLMGFMKWQSDEMNEARQFLSKSRGYFHKEDNKGHLGEGATKTGNAMLLNDRFCDGFEVSIKQIMQKNSDLPAAQIYTNFETNISAWRNQFATNK